MTERKPPDMTFESWVDKQVREATERGEFDDLPGAGQPLPGLHKPHDEMWWIKQKMRDEELSGEAFLPPPLRLRKEAERMPETVRELATEREVRDTVAEFNRRVADFLRAPSGPSVRVHKLDVEQIIQQWHAPRRDERGT